MVEASILLTLHDREPEVILATLRSLYRSGGAGMQIIMVDDRSRLDYSWVKQYAEARFREVVCIETGDYEAWRMKGGENSPAKAFNIALNSASHERVIIMSSDVIVTPNAVVGAIMARIEKGPWVCRVVDLDTGREYCGQQKLFPMPWFLVAKKEDCVAVGGWDESYLQGLCYEDNDFIGRLSAHKGFLLFDWGCTVWHNSHDQPAYKIEDPEIAKANDRNKAITMKKWGGVPFDSWLTPFDVTSMIDKSGRDGVKVTCEKDRLDKAIGMTTGMFAVTAGQGA